MVNTAGARDGGILIDAMKKHEERAGCGCLTSRYGLS